VVIAALVLNSSLTPQGWATIGGAAIVFLAGLIDDLSAGSERGLRGHARSLKQGKPTTGLLKVVAGVAGATFVVVAGGGRRGLGFEIAGVLLIAGCTNIWNGLDVAPGRAIKFFLLFGLPLLAAADWNLSPLLPAMVVPACFALYPDLRERAMLGDSGANLVGFAVGTGLYAALPDWGIVVAAAIVVGLNLVAETVTFTGVIDSARPLRWFDRTGTLPERRSFSAGS
jgi:hypothetical protein